MGLYYTEDGSYRMVHLLYICLHKLNSRDLTTILFFLFMYGGSSPCQPRGSNLQVDRLGLTDGRAPVAHAVTPLFLCSTTAARVCQALCFVFSPVSARPSHGKCLVFFFSNTTSRVIFIK
jgi:hypothetical protein